jgi:hypothetical protein
LCDDGEHIEVEPLAKWRAKLAAKFAGPLDKEASMRATVQRVLAAQSNRSTSHAEERRAAFDSSPPAVYSRDELAGAEE